MAKNASGAEFMKAKKRLGEAVLAQDSGLDVDPDLQEGIFAMQHHHLLSCLEKATVRKGRGLLLLLLLLLQCTACELSLCVVVGLAAGGKKPPSCRQRLLHGRGFRVPTLRYATLALTLSLFSPAPSFSLSLPGAV